ncbi:MAG: DUF523 domain-containing protein [Deltaproteobacteria bacterium]|nr:DUF523 domain-containing protein [Deltaproteobacteria bacterium]
MDRPVVIVSACLVGLKTRYDGEDALSGPALSALKGTVPVPVCPEQLGGLSTPRPGCEITAGSGRDVLTGSSRVMDENGRDVTGNLLKGADEVLRIARLAGAKEAFLKENSPSCGVGSIKRGGTAIDGSGVTAALLEKSGIKVRGF